MVTPLALSLFLLSLSVIAAQVDEVVFLLYEGFLKRYCSV